MNKETIKIDGIEYIRKDSLIKKKDITSEITAKWNSAACGFIVLYYKEKRIGYMSYNGMNLRKGYTYVFDKDTRNWRIYKVVEND